MKKLSKVVLIVCVLVILLANTVYAINFNAEDIYNSVFEVFSGSSVGSGFSIGKNCIITNAHVISDKSQIQIANYQGDTFDAFLVAFDSDSDIAVLGVNGAEFQSLKTADYTTMNIGDDVYAIGTPNSMAYTLTKGVISAKERLVQGNVYIQTDAAINSGNSGGPLLNDDGCVIGVNTLKMSNSEGIGLSIPISRVCNFLQSNGIELNEQRNVQNVIEPKNTPDNENSEGYVIDEKSDGPTKNVIMLLTSILFISCLLNIVLVIILVFQKKKNRYNNIDSSERTDFDIDILE